MHQQLWEYRVEEKLHLGVREQKGAEYHWYRSTCSAVTETVLNTVMVNIEAVRGRQEHSHH
jgi:hypothetical protein